MQESLNRTVSTTDTAPNNHSWPPAAVVGHLQIPPEVEAHRFMQEAREHINALANRADESWPHEHVIATSNTRRVELYGWRPNVEPHKDKTGYIYFVALNDGVTTVTADRSVEKSTVVARKGDVVRLDDFSSHGTTDDQARVCAFLGSFMLPDDVAALEELRKAIGLLAKGEYYGAPRLSHGARRLSKDECLVVDPDSHEASAHLLTDAVAGGLFYEICALCSKPAATLDRYWPYHTERHRCLEHMSAESKRI